MTAPARPPAGKLYGDIVAEAFFRNRASVVAMWGVFALFALAALAPLLANGLPYTIVVDGTRKWPLFAALTAAELITLLAAGCGAAAGITLVVLRRRPVRLGGEFRRATAIPLLVFAAGAGLIGGTWNGRLNNPDEFVALLDSGRAGSAIYPPIRYTGESTGLNDALRTHRAPTWGAAYRFDGRAFAMLESGSAADYVPSLRALAGVRFPSEQEFDAKMAEVLGPQTAAEHSSTLRAAADTHHHLLGTDEAGGDVAARLIHGARTSLAVGFVAVSISIFIGVIVGATMGYFGGRVDFVLMRLMEIVMSIPTLFLVITIVAFWERSLFTIMVVIGITTWPLQARFVRAEFLRLRRQDFVIAAEAQGAPPWVIMFRHMLPNALAPVLVEATFGVGSAIFLEASLNFLGLGPGPQVASWGAMLGDILKRPSSWWLSVFPGAAIFVTVLCYNLVGEGLRDAIDPRLRKAAA